MQRTMNSQSPHWDKNDKEQLRETPGQGQEKDEETRKKLKTKSWMISRGGKKIASITTNERIF